MRVVVDSNIVISAFLWGGNPRRVLNAARSETIDIYTSPPLIAELFEVLKRERFARRLNMVGSSAAKILDEYQALAITIESKQIEPTVSRDPDDDKVLACALTADCEFIVSGDQDLLVLGEYRDIKIMSPAEFLLEIEL